MYKTLKSIELQQCMSRDTVRSFDSYAINTLGMPGVVLMENAGRACADIFEQLGNTKYSNIHKVAILAGKGNNAGDGFVIARHLMLRGFDVEVFLLAAREKISGDAKVNLDVLFKIEASVTDISESDENTLIDHFCRFDFLIDALGGTGITGNLRGVLARAVSAANLSQVPILSVDIPTGVDCDCLDEPAGAVCAAATVTFVAPKPAFSQPHCLQFTGSVFVADIGIAPKVTEGFKG